MSDEIFLVFDLRDLCYILEVCFGPSYLIRTQSPALTDNCFLEEDVDGRPLLPTSGPGKSAFGFRMCML